MVDDFVQEETCLVKKQFKKIAFAEKLFEFQVFKLRRENQSYDSKLQKFWY